MSKRLDLTNQRFNNLIALKVSGSDKHGHVLWKCICDCGNTKNIPTGHLTRKNSPVKSCGCLRRRKGSENPCWGGYGNISGNWWSTHVVKSANAYRKKEVNITKKEAWILLENQEFKCNLSGVPISIKSKTASLDRIDSAGIYELGNVQWVHKDVNIMKNVFDQDRFVSLCKKIVANLSKK